MNVFSMQIDQSLLNGGTHILVILFPIVTHEFLHRVEDLVCLYSTNTPIL